MGIDTSLGRRPTVASVTDVPQRSFAVAAEARGRGRSAHERVGRAGPMPRRGPTLSGSPITFPFKPLEPRGLLLSVMRQKVGKERSQGDCHPLGHPPLLPELGRNNSSKTPRGRVALPPGRGVPRGTRKLELTWHSPLAPTEKLQLESNRAHRARESPPPRAARATFTTFFRSAAAGDPLLDKNRLGPPYFSAQRSLSARLGKSFPINSPFIGLISS